MTFITTIKSRLAKIRAQDRRFVIFGSEVHRYRSFPVPINTIEKYERLFGVTLPDEYRRFLLEVGYGAGPYYGIMSFRESVLEFYDGYSTDFKMSSAFPYTISDAHEIERKRKDGREDAYVHLFPGDYPGTDCLPICHQGCTFSTVLITAGEIRGSVWDVAWFNTWFNSEETYLTPARRPTGLLGAGYSPEQPHLPSLSFNPSFQEWFMAGWIVVKLIWPYYQKSSLLSRPFPRH